MEFHQEHLRKHCRICGNRLNKKKKHAQVYSCAKHQSDLLSTFKVDISSDTDAIHPSHFCNPCYSVTRRAEKANQSGVPFVHATTVMDWSEHSVLDCLVCGTHIHTKKYKIIFDRSVSTSRSGTRVGQNTVNIPTNTLDGLWERLLKLCYCMLLKLHQGNSFHLRTCSPVPIDQLITYPAVNNVLSFLIGLFSWSVALSYASSVVQAGSSHTSLQLLCSVHAVTVA